MIIELHLLQSFPASNLNRDDVGQPKTVTFGGALRGRISSQCMKRSARQLFAAHGLDDDEQGVRTRRFLLAAAQHVDGVEEPSESTLGLVRKGLMRLGFGVDAKTWRTEYLIFAGEHAAEVLAEFCSRNRDALQTEGKKGKTKTKTIAQEDKQTMVRMLDASRAADIALFGRMIADNTDFNVVAASQVAHAFSTHAVATEFDYYTAVDDLKQDDEPGAGMIGAVDFNASLYYRYANLDLTTLAKNLPSDDDLVARAARAWLESFIRARPSGKQNSTAAQTMPETLLTVVREGGSWNLANAFLNPVSGTDLLGASTERLFGHFGRLRGFYGNDEIRAVGAAAVSGEPVGMEASETVGSMTELSDRTMAAALETA